MLVGTRDNVTYVQVVFPTSTWLLRFLQRNKETLGYIGLYRTEFASLEGGTDWDFKMMRNSMKTTRSGKFSF